MKRQKTKSTVTNPEEDIPFTSDKILLFLDAKVRWESKRMRKDMRAREHRGMKRKKCPLTGTVI